jgi:hypothetical protein
MPFAASQSFTAEAASSAPAPSRLCPQPWPLTVAGQRLVLGDAGLLDRPGSASYSPRMAMTGPPSPASPITAVGMPATFASRGSPARSSIAVCSAQERTSA